MEQESAHRRGEHYACMYHIIFPAAVTAALLKEGGVFRAYGERADGRQKLRIGVGEFKNSHFTLWVFAGRAALIGTMATGIIASALIRPVLMIYIDNRL